MQFSISKAIKPECGLASSRSRHRLLAERSLTKAFMGAIGGKQVRRVQAHYAQGVVRHAQLGELPQHLMRLRAL